MILILVLFILFLSCEKELSINDFSDDFSFYETELRIEGVIYPTDNTAIVRIDQSVRIDEADLYDCEDNDKDWNYYHCEENLISYENLNECNENCGDDNCIQHLYECENNESDSLITFIDQSSCESQCQYDCITDDTGTDGFLTPEDENGFIQPDEDGSENNGKPDCNEPNVDEYNEILPSIHVEECFVVIKNSNTSCNMVFNEEAGKFFEEGKDDSFEIISYGGYEPDSLCKSEFDFTNYDTAYELTVTCSESSGYSQYGTITSYDILKRPPVMAYQL